LQLSEWVQAVWLSGSFARGDADRWSDLDVHLLVPDVHLNQTLANLCAVLDRQMASGWHCRLQTPEMVSGLSFVADPADATRGGVNFVIRWTGLARLQSHLERFRPLKLLYVKSVLSDQLRDYLDAPWPALNQADPDTVMAALGYFWSSLSRLPAVLNRREHLATAALINDVRHVLIDLVVALNGAQRPPSPARTNQYLGPSQRQAFEKTLPNKEVDVTVFIGQAVALIVLYRWYAPQLVEMYQIPYPHALERTVLSLLSAEVDGWPALIKTE
jgi:hypothetical protein